MLHATSTAANLKQKNYVIAALQRPKVQSSDLSLTEMLCIHEYLSEPQLCKEEWDKIPP